jgi:hypothetical protein
MAKRYSFIMKTVLLAMFYAPMFPVAFPITLFSLILEYWVGKFVLLRRHCRPETMGKELD